MSLNVIYRNENYAVVTINDALNEMGDARDADGYAVINTKYDVVEITTTILPNALMQADQFNRMVVQILEEDDDTSAVLAAVSEDVSLN